MDTYTTAILNAAGDISSIIARVKDPVTGFVLKDRTYHLKTYPKCFVGSEAVDWINKNVSGISMPHEAVVLGQLLMDRQVFKHVLDSEKAFMNGNYFYRFIADEDVVIHPQPVLEVLEDHDKFGRLVAKLQTTVAVFDRKCGLKTYKMCFSGVEATDTIHKEMKLIVSGECTRENAATVLEKMMDSHLFVNVLKDQRYKFKDDAKALYQFVEPKVWSVLHLKERYDTSKIGAARVKAHGVKPKRAVFLLPGIYASVLECIESAPRPDWQGSRLWLDIKKVGLSRGKGAPPDSARFSVDEAEELKHRDRARQFLNHMMPREDGHSDPPGIKVRPRVGLAGVGNLAEGILKDTTLVYGELISSLNEIGYDSTNLIGCGYDWRIPPCKMEARDGFFSNLKAEIESAHKHMGQPVVLVGHSMGCRMIQYFVHWIDDTDWVQKFIHEAVFLAPPFLGCTFALRSMTVGDSLNLDILLTPKEGLQISRHLGSMPFLMPLGEEFLPDVIARLKEENSETEAKWAPQKVWDVVSAFAPRAQSFWNSYYLQDPHYLAKTTDPEPVALSLPQVHKVSIVYGCNIPTEASYYLKRDSNGEVVLDHSADQLSKKRHDTDNPQALKIKGGIGFETSGTWQRTFSKSASGDGTVAYCSLAYAFYLREQAEAWRQLGKFAPVVDITEVDGVNHRDILKHDVAINTIIDAACI